MYVGLRMTLSTQMGKASKEAGVFIMKDLTIIFKPILSISETLFHVLVFLKKLSVSTLFKTVLIAYGVMLFQPTSLSAAAANYCPGTEIYGSVSGSLYNILLGIGNTNDYYKYSPPEDGSLTISYKSVKNINFDVGYTCNGIIIGSKILSVTNEKTGSITIPSVTQGTAYYIRARYPSLLLASTTYEIQINFFPPLSIEHDNAADLCYENPSDGGLLCIEGLLGIVDLGLLCKETINIRNQGTKTGTEELNDVQVVFGFSAPLVNVDALSDCGVDNRSGSAGLLGGALNGLLNETLGGLLGGVLGGLLGGLGDIINGLTGIDLNAPLKNLLVILTGTNQTCGVDTLVNLVPLAGVGLFESREWFNIGHYDRNETHSIYHVPLLNVALFSNNNANLYGTYVKNGERYGGKIPPCNASITPVTGSFDAWDIYRGDTFGNDGIIDDKNISTKIANKPFSLTIANLDSNGTRLEAKSGASSQVTYGLYSHGSTIPIAGTGDYTFDANTTTSIEHEFTVAIATKEVHVGFKFCASYDGSVHTLADDAECSGTPIESCKENISDTPSWHLCHSSDGFAVRPDRFSLIPPVGEDLELLRSGVQYPFAVYANPFNGSGTNGTEEYNQTKDNLDLDTTILLSDGRADLDNLLHGNLFFGESYFTFNDGISRNASDQSDHVVDIGFDDVGDVNITLQDREWAAIDNGDTPQGCEGGTFTNAKGVALDIPEGAYICGNRTATFIPDHFEVSGIILRNHRDGNFTYLSNDLNMSAHLDVQISARNAVGDVTQNFREGALFYEKPMRVDLNVTDWNASLSNRHPLDNSMHIYDINESKLLGFGGADEANGTHAIAWNDSNLTQRLMFNYQRNNNQPLNPFTVPQSDINISVASTYTSNISGATKTVTGTGVETDDRNATFYFARAKSSKFFYDDVTDSIQTPISVVVYCDTYPTCSELNNEMMINEPYWWLSVDHDEATGDGNITLVSPPSIIIGAGNPTITPDTDITIIPVQPQPGIDTDVYVNSGAGATLPLTVGIHLNTGTSDWLIYNPYDAISLPNPFYKVRFIGPSSTSDWAGHGDTGHVVDSNTSIKKNRRLGW